MDREILFRGKRMDNGEWVKGTPFFAYPTNSCRMIQAMEVHPDFVDEGNVYYSEGFPVAPETVGQFTGLTDKNGQKIFEGDLLDQSILGNDHTLEKIVIRNGCVGYEPVFPDKVHPSDSMWKSFWRQDEQEMWPTEFFAIVGNIHDNPELLEEGHEA